MEEYKARHKRIYQFMEYLFSGGIYFLVGTALLDIFYYGLNWSLWWATITSSVMGWVVNYLMQRYWVFKNSGLSAHQTKVTGRYGVITVVDFLLNYAILWGLRKIGITPAIGQFISAGFFTVWNYVWYRYWVFPDHADQLRLNFKLHHLFVHRAHGHSAFTRGL